MATVPPFYFVGIRFLIGAVLFSVIFFGKLKFTSHGIIKAGIILGSLQLIGFVTQTAGMIYTTASNSALITGVTILIIPFAQYAITRKKVLIENWVGVIIVTVGLYLLTRPELSGFNTGDLITLICPFAWAFYIIYVDVYTNKYDIITLVFLQLWVVVFAAGGMGLIFEDLSAIAFTQNEILSFLYMGILATFITTILLNRFQKDTTPVRASIIYTWEQPAAVLLAVIAINEHFSPWQFIGGGLMVIGILFSETYEYFKGKS